jgi:hypothetical protein
MTGSAYLAAPSFVARIWDSSLMPEETWKAALLQPGYAFDVSHDTVDQVSTYECTASGYSRADAPMRWFGYSGTISQYQIFPAIDFGTIGAGQSVDAIVIYWQDPSAVDSANRLLFHYPFPGPVDTGDFTPFAIAFTGGWFLQLAI